VPRKPQDRRLGDIDAAGRRVDTHYALHARQACAHQDLCFEFVFGSVEMTRLLRRIWAEERDWPKDRRQDSEPPPPRIDNVGAAAAWWDARIAGEHRHLRGELI
jgi:hypothetical protein